MLMNAHLKLWLPLDEVTPTTVYDKSDSGYTGTSYGNISSVTGVFGRAIAVGDVSSGIQIGNYFNYTYANQFTLCCRVKFSPLTAYGQVLSKILNAAPWTGYGISIANEGHPYGSGRIVFDIVNTAGTLHKAICTTETFYDNKWHHIATTYSSTTGLKIYVDGVLRQVTVIYDGDLSSGFTNTVPFIIGNRYTINQGFVGSIEDVQVYNLAFSLSDINRIANGFHPLARKPN